MILHYLPAYDTRLEMREQASKMYWPPMVSFINRCLNRDDSLMDVTVLKV